MGPGEEHGRVARETDGGGPAATLAPRRHSPLCQALVACLQRATVTDGRVLPAARMRVERGSLTSSLAHAHSLSQFPAGPSPDPRQ